MKELKFEELTIRQKLGMVFTPLLNGDKAENRDDDFIIEMIKNHELGSVWIQLGYPDAEELMKRVKEAADYPILIITDAESGIGEYKVGRHNAVGATGSEESAYAFGKATAISARKLGHNVVCDPVVDLSTTGSQRSLGGDKEKVVALAKAIARGMHDGGVLTVAKHYPGGNNPKLIDEHMAEGYSDMTKEELLAYDLQPYIELNNEGLLDGIMTGHKKFPEIDPEHPASLSKKMIDIIREQGFDGFVMTDALCMMGIRAKYDDVTAKGLALFAGNDLLLPFSKDNKELFKQLEKAYELGLVDEARLDEAVKRVLAAQKKVMSLPQDAELTEQEIALCKSIDRNGVYVKKDEGLSDSIDKNGKYLFVVVSSDEVYLTKDSKPVVDTFTVRWHDAGKISEKLKSLFPNSTVKIISQFPAPGQNCNVFDESIGKDGVIFITFSYAQAYVGPEHLTRRLVALINALQHSNKITTVVHFGNPFVLEELPHIPRYILGCASRNAVDACIDVLAGDYPAKGVPTYHPDLK